MRRSCYTVLLDLSNGVAMADDQAFSQIYQLTHDEHARQSFVGAMKAYLNGPVETQLAERYDQVLEPEYTKIHGSPPCDREQGNAAFIHDPLYQLWGAAVYQSQNLMWESVEETCRRLLPELERRYSQLDAVTSLGRLELNPRLLPPEPIRSVEIHRQPGGYFANNGQSELLTGLMYFGTVELYRNAKGLSTGAAPGTPGMGYYILDAVSRRFPDLNPATILDLGCGPGTETLAFCQRFPQAEVWGLDLSAPLLKFAHVWAEESGHCAKLPAGGCQGHRVRRGIFRTNRFKHTVS